MLASREEVGYSMDGSTTKELTLELTGFIATLQTHRRGGGVVPFLDTYHTRLLTPKSLEVHVFSSWKREKGGDEMVKVEISPCFA